MRKTTATPSRMTTSRPSGDASPNSGPFPGGGAGSCARKAPVASGPASTSTAFTATGYAGPRSAPQSAHAGIDAREQVVLGQLGVDEAAHELVVLGGPDLPLHVAGHGEPPARRIDLGLVRHQRPIAHVEPIGALDTGGDPIAWIGPVGRPVLHPLRVGRLHPA